MAQKPCGYEEGDCPYVKEVREVQREESSEEKPSQETSNK